MWYLLFTACWETLPDSIQSPSDVPHTLYERACPEGSVLKHEGDTQFCLHTASEKKDGPSLTKTEEGRVYRYYKKGEESIIPWFLNTQDQTRTKETQAYLAQELSIEQLYDAKTRFRNNRDIQARLVAAGELSPNFIFPQRAATCSLPPKGMQCIEGGGRVQRIFTESKSYYRAFWVERFYADTKLVTKEDVEECQNECACPRGVWNDWNVALAYCQNEGKQLLTENQLWMVYAKESTELSRPKDNEFEWTFDDFVPDLTDFSVEWNSVVRCTENCSAHTAVGPSQKRSSNPKNVGFRCGVNEKEHIQQWSTPVLLHAQPSFFSVTQKWRASWAYKEPQTMLTEVKVGKLKKYPSPELIAQLLWAYHQENLQKLYYH